MYYHLMLSKGNILVDNSQRAVLCDFGLIQIFLDEESTGLTTTSERTGTARYLAPELVIPDYSVYPTTSSDVYAAGCVGQRVPSTTSGCFENLNTLDYSSYLVESPTITGQTICAGRSTRTLSEGFHHPRSQKI
jgi:serine/threonine protein kinase